MKEFKIGQKIVSALGNPMVVTKITPNHIKCEYLDKPQLSTNKPMWIIYRKNRKPYMKLMKDNGMLDKIEDIVVPSLKCLSKDELGQEEIREELGNDLKGLKKDHEREIELRESWKKNWPTVKEIRMEL